MTSKRTPKQTATDAYKNRRMQIEGLMARIQAQLVIEDAKEQKDPSNWGYAGDLAEVEERLQAVADFLPVCLCARRQTCPVCAADKLAGKR